MVFLDPKAQPAIMPYKATTGAKSQNYSHNPIRIIPNKKDLSRKHENLKTRKQIKISCFPFFAFSWFFYYSLIR